LVKQGRESLRLHTYFFYLIAVRE